jgi:Putative prokaryotic signal transducing protein
MKKVFAAKTPTEAHLVRSLLEREAIAAEVHGEWLTGALGEIPLTPDTWPSVWILNDDDEEKAIALVSDYERGEKETG